ncbi:MAG TPA: MFS transporter [Bryobacteraceae bacterium]|nr:MFS transporter [Bryobacteraceae bacterium]
MGQQTSNIRWIICSFLLAISTHAFITRMSMSVAAQPIQKQFGLTNVEIGWVLSAFVVGYGIVQFPVGVLTDRVGPHRLLALTLFSWSALHFLTGFSAWFAAGTSILLPLIAIRFLMGIAQATVLPCCIKAIARWMPLAERATANGFFMMGLGAGGAMSPPLTVALIQGFDWRAPFFLLGILGLALAGAWLSFGRDAPQLHRRVSAAELALISSGNATGAHTVREPTPWRNLLANRSIWCLAFSYGVAGYPSYVFFTWFFLYVVNVHKLDIRAGGYWAALPFVMIAVMTPLGGRASDLLTVRLGKRKGRLGVVLMGAFLASLLILVGARVQDARIAVVLLSLGAGFHLFAQTPSWAATIDIAPAHSATVFGIMNTLAQFAGACAPVLTPLLAERFGWTSALDFAAGMAALAGLLWIGVRPDRVLTPSQPPVHALQR